MLSAHRAQQYFDGKVAGIDYQHVSKNHDTIWKSKQKNYTTFE